MHICGMNKLKGSSIVRIEFRALSLGSSIVGTWKKDQITTAVLSYYSSVFPKGWWDSENKCPN